MARKQNKKRDDNRYAVQIYLGLVDGARKYKTVYGKTQKEADEKALDVKLKLKKGTFCEWKDRWLLLKKAEVSNKRYQSYKCCAEKFEVLNNVPIAKLKTADFQSVISSLSIKNHITQRPASKYTLTSCKNTAAQICQLAIENRVFDYNPVLSVRIPNVAKEADRRALTQEEQQWINDTPNRAQISAMIMMYAGLRRGELIPLTWNDIDLKNKTITINKSVEMKKGKPIVKPFTKSLAGMRTIDIPQKLVNFLEQQPKTNILVCHSAKGKLMTETAWKRMWNSYLLDLNIKYGDFKNRIGGAPKSKYNPKGVEFVIPNITAHWLRHTFATMLYFAGVDILTAKEQLGHADIKTTLEVYTHLDKQFKRKSMNKLDTFLNDASQMQVK